MTEYSHPTDRTLQIPHEPYAQTDAPVPFELWETLAYDLALANTDHDTIANAYEITSAQLRQLQTNSYFVKVLQAKQEEVQQLGSDAAFAVKMRMVANRATPQLLLRLTAADTSNRDFLAMFKTVTELGRLSAPQETANQPVAGASVVFNIQGVPGLEHLSTATPQTADIAEAQWQEVITHTTNKIYADDELEEL